MQDIRCYLKDHLLLFDGAMGTYLVSRAGMPAARCEQANLERPDEVLAIHRAYLQAGAMALKTNTFCVNRPALEGDEALLDRLIAAGWSLAEQAAAGNAYVFADIGPVFAEDAAAEYRLVADRFLQLGARHFLFETLSSLDGVAEAVAYIRERAPESFIILSFAVQPDGFTRQGEAGAALLARCAGMADAVGYNCISGAHHMQRLIQGAGPLTCTLSAMPNAGYPTVVGGRTFFDGDPGYFAQEAARIARLGAGILGGCCGTTPEHIRRVALLVKEGPAQRPLKTPKPAAARPAAGENRFARKLAQGKRVVAVELDPPQDADIARFMEGARRLRDMGADAVTIADCPIGRARMDSSLLACKLRRELDLDPLPHMTCRDRNINATKALLLGLCTEGVHNVLAVTGDPVPSAQRDEVKSVFHFNSRILAKYIHTLGDTALSTPFFICAALNVNAGNFEAELRRAVEKESCGVSAFLTQQVLTRRAAEHLQLARTRLSAKILGGIMPIVSYRNACFLHSEVAGIRVDEQLVELYRDKDKAQCARLAEEVSVHIARQIAPWVDGYYLITPFARVGLIGKIIARLPSAPVAGP